MKKWIVFKGKVGEALELHHLVQATKGFPYRRVKFVGKPVSLSSDEPGFRALLEEIREERTREMIQLLELAANHLGVPADPQVVGKRSIPPALEAAAEEQEDTEALEFLSTYMEIACGKATPAVCVFNAISRSSSLPADKTMKKALSEGNDVFIIEISDN